MREFLLCDIPLFIGNVPELLNGAPPEDRALLAPFVITPSQMLTSPPSYPGVVSPSSSHPQHSFDLVVFSNYMTDLEYLFRVVPRSFWTNEKTRFLFLYGESNREHLEQAVTKHLSSSAAAAGGGGGGGLDDEEQRRKRRNKFMFLKPPLPIQYGTHHSKAIFCFSAECLRVVIGTGNFICDDLERKSQMWYVQDFPSKDNSTATDINNKTVPAAGSRFQRDLAVYFATISASIAGNNPKFSHTSMRIAGNNPKFSHTSVTKYQHATSSSSTPPAAALSSLPPRFLQYDFNVITAAGIPIPFLQASVPGYHVDAAIRLTIDSTSSVEAEKEVVVRPMAQFGMNGVERCLKDALAEAPRRSNNNDSSSSSTQKSNPRRSLVWQYSSQGSLTAPFLESLATVLSTPYHVERHHQNQTQQQQTAAGGGGGGGATTTTSATLPQRRQRHDEKQQQQHAVSTVRTATSSRNNKNKVTDVKIVIPTQAEVRGSIDGWRGGLSIPIPLKNYSPLINSDLHRFTPPAKAPGAGRGWHRAMPHLKTYLRLVVEELADEKETKEQQTTHHRHRHHLAAAAVVDVDEEDKEEEDVVIQQQHSSPPSSNYKTEAEVVVITSCNLSRAAWGERQRQNAQLMIRSYEMGVGFAADNFPPLSANNKNQHVVTSPSAAAAAAAAATPFRLGSSSSRLITPEQAKRLADVWGLFVIPFASSSSSSSTTNANIRRAFVLPYDPVQCQKYKDPKSGIDIPWAIDFPHRGSDVLGQQYAEIADAYSHYGSVSWNARTVDTF